MKRVLAIVGFGAVGILVAVALSLGAFALAGKDISQPASTVDVGASTPTPRPERSESPKPEHTEKPDRNDDQGQDLGPTPSVDDHGGDSTSASGSSSDSNESGSSGGSGSEDGEGHDGGDDD